MESTASDRRSVRQLLFVITGTHTGAFGGSVIPTTFGLPGDVAGGLTILLLFTLPFVVDAKWEYVDPPFAKLTR